jgi:hypothetical protein
LHKNIFGDFWGFLELPFVTIVTLNNGNKKTGEFEREIFQKKNTQSKFIIKKHIYCIML